MVGVDQEGRGTHGHQHEGHDGAQNDKNSFHGVFECTTPCGFAREEWGFRQCILM
jgi:hypothetical protein